MALIKCAECGNEISSLAPACPKCGAPKVLADPISPQPRAKTTTRGKVVAGIFVVLGLVAIFAPKKESAQPVEQAAVKPVVQEKPPEPTPEEKAKQAQEDTRHENIVRSALYIRNRLRNPESLKWEVIKSNASGDLICFGYRAENGFGGMNREQAVVVGTKISSTKANVKKYCSNGELMDAKDYVEAVLSVL